MLQYILKLSVAPLLNGSLLEPPQSAITSNRVNKFETVRPFLHIDEPSPFPGENDGRNAYLHSCGRFGVVCNFANVLYRALQ